MGLGLIGSAIAEGAAGAGEGIGHGIAAGGKAFSAEILEREKQAAIAMREENLARLNNAASMERLNVSEGGADRRLGVSETGATTRQNAGFIHTENLAAARQAFDTEQHRLNRDLTREQIASHEKLAAANNATALKVAQIGGTVSQDTQGNVLWIGKDGKAQKIMDPNDPSKPLVGFKDLTPAAKAYADVIKAQLAGLDREELSAANSGDAALQAKIVDRRAKLNGDLLNVLTGGIGAAGQATPATPSAVDVSGLKSRAKDPQAIAYFESKYGQGSAAKYLEPAAAKPERPAQAPDNSTNDGRLIGNRVPANPQEAREAALRAEYDKKQEEKRKQGAAYDKNFKDDLERTRLRSEM